MTRIASVKAATVAMRSSGQIMVAIEMVRKVSLWKGFLYQK
jgi:hypothetical protein